MIFFLWLATCLYNVHKLSFYCDRFNTKVMLTSENFHAHFREHRNDSILRRRISCLGARMSSTVIYNIFWKSNLFVYRDYSFEKLWHI